MKEILKTVQKEFPITITKTYTPAEFFKNRKGLYIWSGFSNNIVEKAKPIEFGAEFKLSSSDLIERATDEEIELFLPKEHIFSESEICAIVAELIENQPNGEEGTLTNTGYANLFYTSSRVVSVDWRADFGLWHVSDWRRDDVSWDEGTRVFSPATDA